MEVDNLTFANKFTVRSGWKPRVESPEELGQRTLRCLDAITPLHPAFRNWQFIDLSADPFEMADGNIEDYLCALEKARPRMTEVVVEWGGDKDDDGRPFPEGGYSICVLNSNSNVPDSQDVTLTVHGGAEVSRTGRRRDALFETSLRQEADPTIVSYPVFKSVLMAIVSCWDVDYANVFSRDLVQLWTDSRPFCDLSWMVYLSAPLAQRITPPADVVVDRTPDGGLLMIAAEETFDVANPDHVGRARSIVQSLAPLNAEEGE